MGQAAVDSLSQWLADLAQTADVTFQAPERLWFGLPLLGVLVLVLLVVDDYGGTEGLVSLEDVVETLIGIEIVDEADQIADLRRLARQKWQERMKRLGIDPNL